MDRDQRLRYAAADISFAQARLEQVVHRAPDFILTDARQALRDALEHLDHIAGQGRGE